MTNSHSPCSADIDYEHESKAVRARHLRKEAERLEREAQRLLARAKISRKLADKIDPPAASERTRISLADALKLPLKELRR